MGKLAHIITRLGVGAAVAMSILTLGGVVNAADHPTLPSSGAVDCLMCHDDMWEEEMVPHAATEDCSNCHELTRVDRKMRVSFVSEGNELCVMCHDGMEKASVGELEAAHYPVMEDCTSCHDPHASAQPQLLLAPGADLCTGCHDQEELQERHGSQLVKAVRCQDCHNPHGSDHEKMLMASEGHMPFTEGSCSACHRKPMFDRIRLRSRGEKLCTSCHGAFEAPPGGSIHRALVGKRGKAGCVSCHDPHLSENTALLKAEGNEVCAQCHGGIVDKARADGGHEPAADDCGVCHAPHVADNRKLLVEAPTDICAACHDTEDPEHKAKHLGADLDPGGCIGCHDPHGSRNPSLLAGTMHAPLLEGCDICHEGSASELVENGPPELCLMCHNDIREEADTAAVPHGALQAGSCTHCHNPHASPQPKLVKAPGAGPCGDCHDDQVAGPDEFSHGIIDMLGCGACHEPHGSSNEKLLRITGSDLCLACHLSGGPKKVDEGVYRLLDRFEVEMAQGELTAMTSLLLTENNTRNHPVTNHRVLGKPTELELKRSDSTFEGELTCISCHNPHKGKSRSLFRWNAENEFEACSQCHER